MKSRGVQIHPGEFSSDPAANHNRAPFTACYVLTMRKTKTAHMELRELHKQSCDSSPRHGGLHPDKIELVAFRVQTRRHSKQRKEHTGASMLTQTTMRSESVERRVDDLFVVPRKNNVAF